METNTIKQGDCIDLFKGIEDNSIDVTFADPPFNLKKKYQTYKDSLELKMYLDWCDVWIREMARVTKPGGSIFIHNIPKWLTYYTKTLNEISHFRHWISWDAPTAPMGKSLQPGHYGILYYSKGEEVKYYEIRHPHKRCRKCEYLLKDYGGKKDGLHPFGPLVSDCWTDIHRIKHNKYRDEHPCQLPIHLMERIILMSSDEGDVILDPFSGTGTTAIAAKRMGRRYIGLELSEEYAESSIKKLSEEKEVKLGDVYVSVHLGRVATIRDKDWEKVEGMYEIPEERKELDGTCIQCCEKLAA